MGQAPRPEAGSPARLAFLHENNSPGRAYAFSNGHGSGCQACSVAIRSDVSFFFLTLPCFPATYTFHIAGDTPTPWPQILTSIGLTAAPTADILVVPAGTPAPQLNNDTILILEGESQLAASLGFTPTKDHITVSSIEDSHNPKLRIVWEQSADLPRFEIPKNAKVFAKDKWSGAPLIAGFKRGNGAVLWLATSPGPHGYDRFPYVLQALADLGVTPPFRSGRLWAFFDSAYRSRIDLDYFAPRWREAGISALHVAAWHYWESDPQNDAYLKHLIDACHRNGIQVYAWIELPHVSEKFWDQHPEWREKTALLQDAQLDWRKLINLTNRKAFTAVASGLRDLADRFDWDGINLAELYFESLEGHDNPARFTPMNEDVRAEFKNTAGFDPIELFRSKASASSLAKFLDFRADLALRQQTEWLDEIEKIRAKKPWLDVTLTHIDDRFDQTMREKLGASVKDTLRLSTIHDITFLIEDPATIWNLGPERYTQIAARYTDIAPRQGKLAIDINVVERYQDVYPTKQQTGSELFQLVHTASAAFPRVALYFENSIPNADLPLLPASSAQVFHVEHSGKTLAVDSPRGVGVSFAGSALVDSKPWPVASDSVVWLPPGAHSVQPSAVQATIRLVDLNADLKSAKAIDNGMEFAYEASARALAKFDHPPGQIEIDGEVAQPEQLGDVILLPRGQHVVTITRSPDTQNAR